MSRVLARSAAVLQRADEVSVSITRELDAAAAAEAVAWLEDTFDQVWAKAEEMAEGYYDKRVSWYDLVELAREIRGDDTIGSNWVRPMMSEMHLPHTCYKPGCGCRMSQDECDPDFCDWAEESTAAGWPFPRPQSDLDMFEKRFRP